MSFEERRPATELIWAPIRHHSPQCAWQVRQLIERLRPDAVLVEGPQEANGLLPFLLDEQTRPPVAFFIHTRPGGSQQGRCFVPLAAMSPEWVALREAQRLGIAARFIDLPFQARLALGESDSDEPVALEPPLNDDRPLARAAALDSLLASAGCADFETFWERHFESGVAYDAAEPFFARLLQLGQYLRAGSVIDAQTRAREAHMAAAVRETGGRCLIVCGAFHCDGILAALEQAAAPPLTDATEVGVHLVPYSLARLNATRDYAAGIPDCAYHDRVWSLLARRRAQPGDTHREVNAAMAPELAEHLRQAGYAVSLPDVIEAVLLAQRLAALRGHRVGRLEWREALLSCLFKQACDGGEQAFVAAIDAFLAGNASGRLPPGLPLAPLVEDFRLHCRRLRLPHGVGEPLERALDLYRSAGHREQSRLLHRLASLDVPYAQRLAGPRFAAGEDLQRVREVWSIRWLPETEASLTERSHYGALLVDAATARCLERLDAARRNRHECVTLLIDALVMGLHDLLAPILDAVARWLDEETSLPALCQGLRLLDTARHARGALNGEGLQGLDALLAACFQRICLRLPGLGRLDAAHEQALADALADMHNLVTLETPGCEPASFFEALDLLLEAQPAPLLAGVLHGALLEGGGHPPERAAEALRQACGMAWLQGEAPGAFLAGLLRISRHRLPQSAVLLQALDQGLAGWDEETFLTALPGLRLAFAQLSPRQVKQLAGHLLPAAGHAARHWQLDDLRRAADLRDALAQARQHWDGVAHR